MRKPEQAPEPSIEEILASIRRIIADDVPAASSDMGGDPRAHIQATPNRARPEMGPRLVAEEEVLELTEDYMLAEEASALAAQEPAEPAEPAAFARDELQAPGLHGERATAAPPLPGEIGANERREVELEQRFGVQLPALPVPGGEGERGSLDSSMLADVVGRVATIGGMVVNTVTTLVVVTVGGFFLAGNPALYRRGVTKLLPRSQQARADDALSASGQALRLWLIAQFIAMASVGALVGLGTWALGLPSPLALGQ